MAKGRTGHMYTDDALKAVTNAAPPSNSGSSSASVDKEV